jgi:hypothetical protein
MSAKFILGVLHLDESIEDQGRMVLNLVCELVKVGLDELVLVESSEESGGCGPEVAEVVVDVGKIALDGGQELSKS